MAAIRMTPPLLPSRMMARDTAASHMTMIKIHPCRNYVVITVTIVQGIVTIIYYLVKHVDLQFNLHYK